MRTSDRHVLRNLKSQQSYSILISIHLTWPLQLLLISPLLLLHSTSRMSSRLGLRLLQARAYQPLRMSFRQPLQRRLQSTVAETKIEPPSQSAVQKLWNSPVGPKTVHFWYVIQDYSLTA